MPVCITRNQVGILAKMRGTCAEQARWKILQVLCVWNILVINSQPDVVGKFCVLHVFQWVTFLQGDIVLVQVVNIEGAIRCLS